MPKSNRKYNVLHLARWYPNRYDPMPGLFIQRHVEASNLYCNAGVVYTHIIDNSEKSNECYELDYKLINLVPTAKVYYKSSSCRIVPVKKLVNIFRFFKANRIGINRVSKELGGVNIIHIHILTRLGIIGLFHKLIYKTPYIITEHWSRYLDLTGSFVGYYRKAATRVIVKNADAVTAVTENLATAMKSHRLTNPNYIILPNVVDDVFLKTNDRTITKSNKINFLHVSCFEDKSKNISGLLRVIKELKTKRDDFVFTMVGDGMDMDWIRKYSDNLGLKDDEIVYTGLLEGNDLVKEMSNSDMLVIFSNYENFPVVINESLALGVPVIATKVGGIPERVNDTNGLLVNPGDENELLTAFEKVLDNKLVLNMNEIKNQAREEFSPSSIGTTLQQLYKQALGDS